MGAPTVLLVEDEAVIGFAVFDLLNDAGIEVLGPCRTVREALHVTELFMFDAAVIDFELCDSGAGPLFEQLDALDVPYCVISGHQEPDVSGWRNLVQWIEKPFREEDLLRVIRRMTG